MKILLTGASGALGQKLLTPLSAVHDVTVVGRHSLNSGSPIREVICDLRSHAEVQEVSRKLDGNFDAVFHLASFVPTTKAEDQKELSFSNNVQMTQNLISAFEGRFDKFIFASSAEVYKKTDKPYLINEQSEISPRSFYAESKVASESVISNAAKTSSFSFLNLRFSLLYGYFDRISRALPNFIRNALAGEPISVSGSECVRDYIHLDDAVRKLIGTLEVEFKGPLNVASGLAISVGSLAERIVEISNSTSTVSKDGFSVGGHVALDTRFSEDILGKSQSLPLSEGLLTTIKEFI